VVELQFEAEIRASIDRVFALLADLRSYDRWLPRSKAFHGTNHISRGPTVVGTTYVEPGPFGVRHGRVTELTAPTRLCFEQPMMAKPAALGVIGIRLTHVLAPTAGGVHLVRTLQHTPRGPIKLATQLLVTAFRTENKRMMKALKAFAEQDARHA
jgi:uncharacterized protein YndB with AHSA1/START domain